MFATNRASFAPHFSNALLRDGPSVCIRMLGPEDHRALAHLFTRMGPRSLYLRFMQAKTEVGAAEVTRLLALDPSHEWALAATHERSGKEELLGVAWCFRTNTSAKSAEVAFAVADEYRGHGLATVLLEQLAELARPKGVSSFEADVLGSNAAMLDVFLQSGMPESSKRSAPASST